MATAELDIRIHSRDVPNATRELQRLEKQGALTEKGMGGVSKAMSGAAGVAGAATVAAAAIAAATNKMARLADVYTTMEARVKRLGGTASESAYVWSQLSSVATETGGDLSATVALWESLDQSIAASDSQIVTLVGTLQKLGKIGGSSSEEMSNAMRQLGQSFAGGVVRAEEFNSVLEQAPEIWRRIASAQDISLGQLRTKMLEGKLTSDEVFKALIDQTEKVNADFDKMPRTVEAASNALKTSFGKAISEVDKEIGASKYLAKFMDTMAKGLDFAFSEESQAQTKFNELMDTQVKLKESIAMMERNSPTSTIEIERAKALLESVRSEMAVLQEAQKQRIISSGSGKSTASEAPVTAVTAKDDGKASKAAEAAKRAYDAKIEALAREQQAEEDGYQRRLAAAGEFNARMEALNATELEKAASQRSQRMVENQMNFNNGLISEEQYQLNLTAIKQKYTNERVAIEEGELRSRQEIQSSMMGAASGFFDGMAGMASAAAGEQSGIYKGMFAASKGFATMKAALDMQMAISDALGKGFPQNIPLMAQAASAGAQIATSIGGLNYTGAYDKGGYIPMGGVGLTSEKRDEFINGVLVKGPARITGGAATEKKIEAAANGGGGGDTYYITQNITGNGDEALARVVQKATKAAVDEVQRDAATNGRIRKTLGV